MKGSAPMKSNRKLLPVAVIAGGIVLAFFILRMEKAKVADPHEHGGEEEAAPMKAMETTKAMAKKGQRA